LKTKVLLFYFLILIACETTLNAQTAIIQPDLQPILEALGSDDEIPVIVMLSDRAELDPFREMHKGLRRANIIRALKEKADLTQEPIREHLGKRGVTRIVSLWLINGVAVTTTRDVIEEIAALPGIESIGPDYSIPLPVITSAASSTQEWNLTMIHAPELWAMGFTGEGVVVASMDTGVDVNHPDLKTRWRGGTNSWFDPFLEHSTPYDALGHGTMTMGIMMGGNASGKAIGVAPGAKWIAVRIWNDAGEGTYSAVRQGFQWLLDPDGNPDTDDAPDIVNNSWGLQISPETINKCLLDYQPDIQVLKAAGIAVVFAAGNAGPGASTSMSPGNYPESFAAGAVDQFKYIAPFSSRGPAPSDCGGRVYPDVVSPGVSVMSSVPGGEYSVANGTSFASPHVAGAMALLLSASPGSTVSELELALKETAVDLGDRGPDNTYGNGLINVLEAYYNLGGFTDIVRTFTSVKADDGWVRESSAGSGIGGTKSSSSLILGDDALNRQYKGILSFDTFKIPAGATIKSATLTLKRQSQSGATPFLTQGPCYVDVAYGTFGAEKLEKTDFQAPATVCEAGTLSNPSVDGAISTGVVSAEGLPAINKDGVTQMRIYCSQSSDNNGQADYIKFYAGGNRKAENNPTLEVTYTP